MDNIWIILLIVGAVISLTQKNTKRRPQTDSDEEEQPRDVLQKHLEEIFGRGAEHPAAPRPTAMPMPQPPVRKPSAETADTAPAARPKTQDTAPRQQTAEPKKHIRSTAETSARDTSHRNRAMAQATRRQQHAIEQQQLRKGSAETPAHHSDNELERIIEEFDMERAVIYSEILKPKYEEY